MLPEFREFERFSTTAINATVGPRMERYLDRFLERLTALGVTTPPYTVHSNGGLMSVETVRRFPVRTCLSGPDARGIRQRCATIYLFSITADAQRPLNGFHLLSKI